jgi:hypothetical protein
MSYSEFTIDKIKKQFHIIIDETTNLFSEIKEAKISDYLRLTLDENIPLALAVSTEKARSELIISPVLVELRKITNHKISLFPGVDFNVDAGKGLNGICDYIIAKSSEQLAITAPVIMLVEAKNEDMIRGYGQCIAEMIAAQKFNSKENVDNKILYGAVTTGNIWRFLKLENSTVNIDLIEYHISQINKIFGILLYLVS